MRSLKLKNITFNKQINQNLKNKTKGRYVHTRISLRMQLSACVHSPDLAHAYRFSETIQDKFSAFMLRFGTNPTSSGDHSQPFFHTIKSLIWYIFKIHKNPMEKHQDSLEIVN